MPRCSMRLDDLDELRREFEGSSLSVRRESLGQRARAPITFFLRNLLQPEVFKLSGTRRNVPEFASSSSTSTSSWWSQKKTPLVRSIVSDWHERSRNAAGVWLNRPTQVGMRSPSR